MRSVESAECKKKSIFQFNSPFLILIVSMMSVENEACEIWKVTLK